MAGFYNCLIFWNGRTLQFKLVMPACKTMAGFINCFPLDFYVYLTKVTQECVYSLYVSTIVCSVMIWNFTLEWEHVTVYLLLFPSCFLCLFN